MTKQRSILLVDDDPRILLVLCATLENLGNGTELVTSSNGREALTKFKDKDTDFDLVISDVRMPGLNGIELARAIRAINTETAIIWITAFGCRYLEEEGERLNVFRCLEKPIRIKVIRQAATDALGPTVPISD